MSNQSTVNTAVTSKAKAVYDGIGNEIFDGLADKLSKDATVQEFRQHDGRSFAFDDGSEIAFRDGFAYVTEPRNPSQVPSVSFDGRVFMFGALMVASVMALFKPAETGRAVIKVVTKCLEKEGQSI